MSEVPEMQRRNQDSEKYYEPNLISFGPYHHDKPHLRAAGNIKPICVRKFLADSNQDIEDLYKKIESNIKAVRVCYDTLAMTKYNDEKLAGMMLLDGCFILQFIHSSAREEDMSNLLRSHEISLVELDLFLLENQIPFGILRLIFEGAQFKDGSRMKYMINRFVADRNGILPAGYGRGLPQLPEESSHLLHLMRIALRPTTRGFLTDISFESNFFRGSLKLPQITIDEFTHTRCLNILAYEMCSEGPDDYAVTSYICFLGSLIDDADDVKELR